MLSTFYMFGILLLGAFLIVAFLEKNKEFIKKVVTLMSIWTIICLVFYSGEIVTTVCFISLFTLGLYELSKNYKINFLCLLLVTFGFGTILFIYPELMKYFFILFLTIIILTFFGSSKIISTKAFVYLFSIGFVVYALKSLFLIYSENVVMIVIIIMGVQFSDGFGYVFGKKFGKTKVFKILSPNKSIEGYAFSALGIIIWLVILNTLLPVFKDNNIIFDFWLFLVLFMGANLGDLLFSSIKRKINIKDFSNVLPGHGGVFDRFDSMLLTAPFFLILLKFM